MIVTKENINKVEITEKEKSLLLSLLDDVDEFNELIGYPEDNDNQFIFVEKLPRIWISWQNYHDEYSPENLEAPDNYGCFRICISPVDIIEKKYHSRIESRNAFIPISSELTLDELDTNLCSFVGYFSDARDYYREFWKKFREDDKKKRDAIKEREKTAKEKYKDYKPAVGDICMKLVSHNGFYRISCNVFPAFISRIVEENGETRIFTRNVNIDEMRVLKEANPQKWYNPFNGGNYNIHDSARSNDQFAEISKECKRKSYGSYLISRWMAVEIIDEFLDRYEGKKTTNRFLWHSCQPEKVYGTTIIKHLKKLKDFLTDDDKISKLYWEEQTPPEMII